MQNDHIETNEKPSAEPKGTSDNKHKKAKTLKLNKDIIYCACAILAVVVIALIAWATTLLFSQPELSEEFFVSDDTKTTISLKSSNSNTSSNHETHVVYDYDNDNNVISMKTYFDYKDAESAAAAYESLKNQPEFKGAELKDNFIIVTADESQYKGLTASDIRQQAEAIRAYQAQFEPQSEEEPAEPESEEPLLEESLEEIGPEE